MSALYTAIAIYHWKNLQRPFGVKVTEPPTIHRSKAIVAFLLLKAMYSIYLAIHNVIKEYKSSIFLNKSPLSYLLLTLGLALQIYIVWSS